MYAATELCRVANDWIDAEFESAWRVNRQDGQRCLWVECENHGTSKYEFFVSDRNTAIPLANPSDEDDVRDLARQWLKSVPG